jgi:hypothetical protein
MRHSVAVAALAVAFILAGCGEWTGEGDESNALLLYANPRTLPPDGQHTAVLAAEVVKPSSVPGAGPWCVRVVSQLGTLGSASDPGPPPDDGGVVCPSGNCIFLDIPDQGLRRQFAIYRAGTVAGTETLFGDLFQEHCPPTSDTVVATQQLQLTLGEGSSAPADMSASVMSDLGSEGRVD